METEDAALWRAVVADPHDDAPRLVLADWLEEHGQPERAEFIRLQCRLARLDEDDPDRGSLERRESQLWHRHRVAWRAPLPHYIRDYHFRRGFPYPDKLHVTAKRFLQLGDDVFFHAPLWEIILGARGPVSSDGLASSPQLRQVAGLGFGCRSLDPAWVGEFLASPNVENVGSLRFGGWPHDPDGLRVLARSPVMRRVTRLSLSGSELGRDGAEALAESGTLDNLEVLELVYCRLGDAGLRALLGSPV